MAVYTRTKIQTLGALMSAMHEDLKAAGFVSVLPSGDTPLSVTNNVGKFVVESTAAVNPLDGQPYRILVEVFTQDDGHSMRVAIANPQQINDSGAISSFPYVTPTQGTLSAPYQGHAVMGQLGAKFSPLPYRAQAQGFNAPASEGIELGDVFISRNGRYLVNYDSGSTMRYTMVTTPRGVSFFVQEDASDQFLRFSFFSVQAPLRKDGTVINDLNTPMFCVYNCDNTTFNKFVISESDVFRPTPSVSAVVDTPRSSAILNIKDQVSLRVNNKYMIQVPNRLNTDRYALEEELDMIAYASADVIPENGLVTVRFYGEDTDRVYMGMKSAARNVGMRLLMLVEGGGVEAPVVTP